MYYFIFVLILNAMLILIQSVIMNQIFIFTSYFFDDYMLFF